MAMRRKMSRGRSKRVFKKFAKRSHKKNFRVRPMRGGFRI